MEKCLRDELNRIRFVMGISEGLNLVSKKSYEVTLKVPYYVKEFARENDIDVSVIPRLYREYIDSRLGFYDGYDKDEFLEWCENNL